MATAREYADRTSGVQSVERAFGVLEVLAAMGGTGALGELAARAGLPLPTMHRLARTLLSMGYLRQLPNRHYSLGPRLIRLGESAGQLIGMWSRPHLSELADRTGETANMAVLDNDMAVYVAQVPSPHSMRMFTEVGRRSTRIAPGWARRCSCDSRTRRCVLCWHEPGCPHRPRIRIRPPKDCCKTSSCTVPVVMRSTKVSRKSACGALPCRCPTHRH
jgi:hypothetical protein